MAAKSRSAKAISFNDYELPAEIHPPSAVLEIFRPQPAAKIVAPAVHAAKDSVLPVAREEEVGQPTVIISEEYHALILNVWGAGVLDDRRKCKAIIDTHLLLAEQTGHILRSVVGIGRSLLHLKEVLSNQEFERGLRESQRVFRGWSAANLSKFMNIATFMDSRGLRIETVPQSYSVLYEFSTLADAQFEHAKKLGLFRPDVRRSEVTSFKQHLRESGSVKVAAPPADASHSAELAKVNRRIRDLERELARLHRARDELQSAMGTAGPSRKS